MKRDELIEAMARVTCDEWGYLWDGPPDDEQTAPEDHEPYDTRPSKVLYRTAATAALTALEAALSIDLTAIAEGRVVCVPVEPKAEAVDAGARYLRGQGIAMDCYTQARGTYRAMLAARSAPHGQ